LVPYQSIALIHDDLRKTLLIAATPLAGSTQHGFLPRALTVLEWLGIALQVTLLIRAGVSRKFSKFPFFYVQLGAALIAILILLYVMRFEPQL
jgi:hypothetical protein